MRENNPRLPLWGKRLLWLVLIWAGSVLSLAVVAFLIKKLMLAAGMSS